MIMPRAAAKLLLPANPWFIGVTLVIAMMIDMVPVGRVAAMPDVLAVVLVFWGVHQPQRVGMGIAFALGLCIDVHQVALLGQHALAYTALMFGAGVVHRRLLWLGVASQALQMLPLFIAAHALELLVRMVSGGIFPGLAMLVAPAVEAALWPLASWVLLAPQRRPPDRDENRPL